MRSPYNEHGHEHSLIPYLKKNMFPGKTPSKTEKIEKQNKNNSEQTHIPSIPSFC
jgi:hypothetical protein